MAKEKTRKTTPVPFETALEQLKQIVADLEAGNLSLDESLSRYEQGIASLRLCHEALGAAKQKIEQLVDLDEDGNLLTRPYDATSSTDRTDGVRRTSPIGKPQGNKAHSQDESVDDGFEDVDDSLDQAYGPEGSGELF